ncbi:hypothetical protein EVAR_83021_1 [Eumeta japonica]|uniref:Uncharacterized protein n=1 Tax=Eumeta variegata TaxID=151549 RepID=A0A4C1T356_EUMVA|nr:hypothetical protein EVAR_83021_1 [Eumeta japonica]
MDRDAFAAAYTAQIEKLIENGYARRLENRAQVRDCFFLPHFAVTNPNKPNKIRVVFDAAARSREPSRETSGTCFCEYVSALPINERSYFCEVPIATASPCVRDDFADFGASSSPTSDLRTQQNAETCSDEYPNAEMAVKRDHYVDDFICSTDSVPEAAKLISDVTIVLHARGFDIRGGRLTRGIKRKPVGGVVRRPPPCHKTKERALEAIYGNRNATV